MDRCCERSACCESGHLYVQLQPPYSAIIPQSKRLCPGWLVHTANIHPYRHSLSKHTTCHRHTRPHCSKRPAHPHRLLQRHIHQLDKLATTTNASQHQKQGASLHCEKGRRGRREMRYPRELGARCIVNIMVGFLGQKNNKKCFFFPQF